MGQMIVNYSESMVSISFKGSNTMLLHQLLGSAKLQLRPTPEPSARRVGKGKQGTTQKGDFTHEKI